MSGNY